DERREPFRLARSRKVAQSRDPRRAGDENQTRGEHDQHEQQGLSAPDRLREQRAERAVTVFVADRERAERRGAEDVRRQSEDAIPAAGGVLGDERRERRPARRRERARVLRHQTRRRRPGHAAAPGCTALTKISSSVSDSAVSVSGACARSRAITSAALPLTTTSTSR